MDTNICVLSVAEAARLENWSIWPKCNNGSHKHIPKKKADELVAQDDYRYVGGECTAVMGPVTMIVPVAHCNGWVPVGTSTEVGLKLMGMRTWGNSPRG